MSKVSWKEIEQAFEDEKPIDDGIVNFTKDENWREYDEWVSRKEERLRNERPSWDDDAYYDWLCNEWDDDSNWDDE